LINLKKKVTEQYIEDFSKSKRYFINGEFAKFLTGTNNIYKKGRIYIDILSKIYEKDLAQTFIAPLFFIIKEKMIYENLYISKKE
jgi:hypothetical protein